ncbi:hypothetical protein [Catellatospora sp. NPDC049609]|uniref:hypothetical protein n=1 Tax=Catellatospora sp. NPDC049609 TaxID=3155505 RepID=UPI00343E039F
MTRLVGNRAYGVNAGIEARFSQGQPWPISIITYDPPTQTGATGTTSSFVIPTQFRGDQLAPSTEAATYLCSTPRPPCPLMSARRSPRTAVRRPTTDTKVAPWRSVM